MIFAKLWEKIADVVSVKIRDLQGFYSQQVIFVVEEKSLIITPQRLESISCDFYFFLLFYSKCFDCVMSVTNCLFFNFFLVQICSALFVSLLSDLDIFVLIKDQFNVMFIIDLCLLILFCVFFSGICLVRYFLFNPRSLLLEDKERAGRKRLVALKEKLKKKSGEN